MRGRKRTELSEEQKNQVQELVKQGKGMDQISKEIHVHFSKLKEYLDANNIQTNTKAGRPKNPNLKPKKSKVIHKKIDYSIEVQEGPIIDAEYDMTLCSYEYDQELAMKLRRDLGYNYTIEVHQEVELGGIFYPYVSRSSNKDIEYPKEKHIFDIYIPEKQIILLPNFDRSKWAIKIGTKLRPNPSKINIDNSYIYFLMEGCWNTINKRRYCMSINNDNYNNCIKNIKNI